MIVGFGSTFVWAALGARTPPARSADRPRGQPRQVLRLSKRLSTPFIYAAGAFGIVLVILSDKGQVRPTAWITIAFVLFIIGALVAGFIQVPAQKRLVELQEELVNAPTAADVRPTQVDEITATTKKIAGVGGFLHLIFLLLMIDMVWGSFHFHGF